jgi:hypothetical protein
MTLLASTPRAQDPVAFLWNTRSRAVSSIPQFFAFIDESMMTPPPGMREGPGGVNLNLCSSSSLFI